MNYKFGVIAAGTIAAVGVFGLVFAIKESAEALGEGPKYRVIKTLGKGVEVRLYQSATTAQVTVKGDKRDALNEGFKILAAYIFGKNARKTSLKMTSPVVASSEKLKMTSPVTSESTGNTMIVSFFMPHGYSLDTLPEPQDSRIHFLHLPERKLAAIRFSGAWNPHTFSEHAEALVVQMRISHLEPIGEPYYAYYDPPFMPPFMRRNEVLISIAD
jgi:effector-binding domain-containing protein